MGNAMLIPHRMHLSWEVITAFECRFYLISSSSPITCHVGCLFRSALDSQPFIAAHPPYPSATESENGCRKTPTNHSSLSFPSVSVCLSPDNWDPFLQVCPDHCVWNHFLRIISRTLFKYCALRDNECCFLSVGPSCWWNCFRVLNQY